ncbi:hypothetical protein SAMN05216323_10518 [Williamwhitmania taraxaci]|uniref:Uncharacterized protein n=1 Tax=Williamwhitmania taraxaci TaxID=1640674 RepID=A0A1G6PG32_9BACT|nr:hypothetical protein SAMN05216323_10518 [Williamwhitmania taraxaci]
MDITELLKSKEGKKIKLTVVRNEEKITVKFRLRKLV